MRAFKALLFAFVLGVSLTSCANKLSSKAAVEKTKFSGVVARVVYKQHSYCYDLLESKTAPAFRFCLDELRYDVGDLLMLSLENAKVREVKILSKAKGLALGVEKRKKSKKSSIAPPKDEYLDI